MEHHVNHEVLKLVRKAYGSSLADFAEMLEVGESTLRQCESGLLKSHKLTRNFNEKVPKHIIEQAEELLKNCAAS